jgi:kinesin family protein 5
MVDIVDMFVIAIEQKAADGSTKTGRLNLIDLAGSEKISKTGATGDTLEEVLEQFLCTFI